jgi:hypothetical protein
VQPSSLTARWSATASVSVAILAGAAEAQGYGDMMKGVVKDAAEQAAQFPAVIAAIARAADAELGAGAGFAAARPNETSRKRE